MGILSRTSFMIHQWTKCSFDKVGEDKSNTARDRVLDDFSLKIKTKKKWKLIGCREYVYIIFIIWTERKRIVNVVNSSSD